MLKLRDRLKLRVGMEARFVGTEFVARARNNPNLLELSFSSDLIRLAA
jgi:hypothetical protein